MTAPRSTSGRLYFRRCLLLFVALGATLCGPRCFAQPLVWQSLPGIPDDEGFAGSFAGVSGGALLVAGGANFPELKPWEGGTKRWYDAIFVLDKPTGSWRLAGKLLQPLGYGVSITTPDGLACIGGSNADGHFAECFLLRWTGSEVETAALPDLPQPCANACGALVDRTIYVAGGTTSPGDTQARSTFWSLDLDGINAGWTELAPWPGPERTLAVAGSQAGSFYLFGGVSLSAGSNGQPVRQWLLDAYRFTPGRQWQPIAEMPRGAVAAPSPAPALGVSHLLVLGGDDGAQLDAAPLEHRGFPRDVLSYNTLLDRWSTAGNLPFSLVTTSVAQWNGRIVVPGGETRPGVRSTEVWSAAIESKRAHFGWLNYVTLCGYLLGMVGIGWYCAGLNKNTDDYFKAGGRIPWWAAGLSIYATMLSSLTFMAIPAKAFASDWTFFWANVPILLLAPIVIRYYLPFFRQLDVTSAYEYLEKRFSLVVRLYGSGAFILFQIGRQAIVLLLPALALTTVSDLDVRVCIVLMGALCMAYTMMGGIQAVIWTDVAQSIVLLGAAALSLGIILWRFDGTVGELVSSAAADGKLNLINWTLDPSTAANAFWVILVGNLFIILVPYTSDQAVIQRYLTTHSEAQAARAIWTNALLAIPSTALFFAIGTALYVFYRAQPETLDPTQPTDAVFPAFIVANLPAGIAGLAIAGIFAAAQSTVSSSLNSVVTALMTDFFGRLRRPTSHATAAGAQPNEHDAAGGLRFARLLTAGLGILATAAALLLAEFETHSLWDAYNGLVGLAGSGLAGLFALGIFTRRANAAGALVGAIVSAATLYLVQQHADLHFFLYAMIGVVTCFVVGWTMSLVLPGKGRPLAGLTIYDLKRR